MVRVGFFQMQHCNLENFLCSSTLQHQVNQLTNRFCCCLTPCWGFVNVTIEVVGVDWRIGSVDRSASARWRLYIRRLNGYRGLYLKEHLPHEIWNRYDKVVPLKTLSLMVSDMYEYTLGHMIFKPKSTWDIFSDKTSFWIQFTYQELRYMYLPP